MNIQIQREALAEAMGLLGTVIPKRSPKPVLQCVRISATDKVVLYGTNLETAIRYEVPAVVDKPGEVLIQADLLGQIARAGRSDVFVMREAEGGCEIVEEDARYNLYTMDPKGFQQAPVNEEEPDAVVSLEQLRSGLRRTEFAAATETSRYAIGGVFLKQGKGKTLLVATDGRRLACCHVEDEAQMETKGIVPPKAVKALAGIPVEGKESVRVTVRASQAWFTCGPVSLTTNLVAGKFPDYEQIIPKDCPVKLRLNTEATLGAIRQAATLLSAETLGVKLSLSKGRVSFESFGDKQLAASASVPVPYKGQKMEIGFNPQYVTEALQVIEDEEFDLELSGPTSPALIRAEGDFLYVFMPINLS